MKVRVVTLEMVRAVHIVEVPADFVTDDIDDYSNFIADQDSEPVALEDAQIYEVVSAEEIRPPN